MRWIGSIGTMDDMTNPLIIHRSTPAAEHSAEPPEVAPTKSIWTTRVARVLTGSLALFLISSGAAKFGGGHVFQYIEHKSGIDLFHPFSNYVVGAAEVMAGAFILFRRTRLAGALRCVVRDGRRRRVPPVALARGVGADRTDRGCGRTVDR